MTLNHLPRWLTLIPLRLAFFICRMRTINRTSLPECITFRELPSQVPKTGWLTQQKCIVSQFWMLEVQTKVLTVSVPLRSCEGGPVLCLAPSSWWCADHLWLVNVSLQHLPLSSRSIDTVCVHIIFPLCMSVLRPNFPSI